MKRPRPISVDNWHVMLVRCGDEDFERLVIEDSAQRLCTFMNEKDGHRLTPKKLRKLEAFFRKAAEYQELKR